MRCHGVNLEELADVERWPLLEQPTPELCADRIDYTLRDLLDIGWITFETNRSGRAGDQ